jgi:hypothetical protein
MFRTRHDELINAVEELKEAVINKDNKLSGEEIEDKIEELKEEAVNQVHDIYENFDCINMKEHDKLVEQITTMDHLVTDKGVENRAENIIAKINDKVYL